jgi:hemerythrin
MPLITWDSELSVGIREIDEQHKKMVEIINELHDAMYAGKGVTVLADVVRRLVDYTVMHFGTEERYFKQYDYPDSARHKNEHDGLTKKTMSLADAMQRGENVLSVDVMQFLKDWLITHILGSDKAYAPFLNRKGLS